MAQGAVTSSMTFCSISESCCRTRIPFPSTGKSGSTTASQPSCPAQSSLSSCRATAYKNKPIYALCYHFGRKIASMLVSRVSTQEPDCIQGGNLMSSEFKRLLRERNVGAALEALDGIDKGYINPLHLVELVQLCEEMKLVDEGKRVFHYVMTHPLKFEVVVYNKLVEMLCKLGAADAAKEVFDKMPERNLESWNQTIKGFPENGEGERALEVFSRMKEEGWQPDGSTFEVVIKACVCLGAVDAGLDHFASMSRDYGITPSVEHYIGIIDLLGSSKQRAELSKFVTNIPIEQGSVVWEALQKHSLTEPNVQLGDLDSPILPSGLNLPKALAIEQKSQGN